nr:6977_t:CDS:2 [Entrophospora candida]
MFKDQLHFRGGSTHGRLFTRRNNIVKFILVVLLICTTILIAIMKPWAEHDDSPTVFTDESPPESKTDIKKTKKPLVLPSELIAKIKNKTSHYKKEQFTEEALKKNGLIPVTAILLGWKRRESLQLVVSYLSKYPFVKEILIWNNNDEIRLNVKDFKLINSDGMVLNVFNSDENLHDLSKHTTCSMAKYDYCYYQDDDWLNMYMDSMYTNFLNNPSLIHSNTMPIIHLEHRRWMFANADKNLHTGFTWFGCGSFVPRAKVQRFLGQLGSISLAKERLKLSDMYFSIWTNQYPYQLSNPLTPLDQQEGWSNTVNTGSELFVREEEKPYFSERNARAPCLNDKCLFITNIDPFPHPSRIYYANNVTHIHEHEHKFNELDFPSNTFWDQHAYHNAVDLDEKTCWNSFRIPHVGDYFGLHFIEPKSYKKIKIISSKDISNFDASFNIKTSSNDTLDKLETNGDSNVLYNSITIEFDCINNEPISFIKVEASRNFTEPFDICSMVLDDNFII